MFAKNCNMFNVNIGLSLYTVLAKSNENWFFDHKIRELDSFGLWASQIRRKNVCAQKTYVLMV